MSAPRTILITGASSGIGAALAIGYARYGVTLILIARNEERLAEIVKSCRARGAQTITTYIDVRDHDAMAAFITQVDAVTPIEQIRAACPAGVEAIEMV